MVEHPHPRYRTLKKIGRFFASLPAAVRERDEQALEPYAFLQEAGEDLRGQLDRVEKRTWRLLAVCAAGSLLLFLLLSVSGMASPGLSALLVRPDPDDGKTEADVTLRLDYKGASHEEDIQVEIPPRERTRAETEALFDRCEAELREDVFAGGEVLRALRSGLQLPLASRDGSVAITWSSSDPARVSESGSVDLVGAQQGETVTLTAVLSAGEYARRLDFEASLSPDTVEDWEESLRQEAAALARELPGRLTDREQILPETSPSGAQAQWTLRKRALPWEIAGLCVFACAAILFSRTDALQRRLKKQKRALEQEIPNMTMQMILLLNAGLTVETAFTRLITENSGRDEPLYRSFSRLEAEFDGLRQSALCLCQAERDPGSDPVRVACSRLQRPRQRTV